MKKDLTDLEKGIMSDELLNLVQDVYHELEDDDNGKETKEEAKENEEGEEEG